MSTQNTSVEHSAEVVQKSDKRMKSTFTSQSMLGDIVWFIGQPVSKARFIDPEAHILDIIQDRCNIFGDPAKEMKKHEIDFDQEINFKKITIQFSIDRYSELAPQQRTYIATNARKITIQCANLDELEQRKVEILDKHESCGYSKDKLELNFYDKEDVYFTTRDILMHIYLFYHQIMTNEELLNVSNCDDGWGYAERAKKALEHGNVLYRHEIMGDRLHFEGLGLIENGADQDPVFELILGS